MTLFLIIFKQEQNAISCKPASPRRVSFCHFVRVRFIEEEHQAQNALCCIPVGPRRVSFLPFRERKVYRGEVRKVRKNLLEKTGKWEDKLPKLTCKTKIEAKEKKWHLTTKHTLIPLHT
jgi:hypothetical protein